MVYDMYPNAWSPSPESSAPLTMRADLAEFTKWDMVPDDLDFQDARHVEMAVRAAELAAAHGPGRVAVQLSLDARG